MTNLFTGTAVVSVGKMIGAVELEPPLDSSLQMQLMRAGRIKVFQIFLREGLQ
jgi:hypothetical protein